MKTQMLLFLMFFPFALLPQNNFIEQITNGDFDARNPFISPKYFVSDFEKVFFEIHNSGFSNIYSIIYQPSTETFSDTIAITHSFAQNINPSYQTYSGLLFQTNRNGNWDIMFAPDSFFMNLGELRFLTSDSEDEEFPKFIKFNYGENILDSTTILFKRGDEIIFLSIKANKILEQVVFKSTSEYYYTEFDGLFNEDDNNEYKKGYYIFAIEENINNSNKRIVSRHIDDSGLGDRKILLDNCDCGNLDIQSLAWDERTVPIFLDTLNRYKRFFYLTNWDSLSNPSEIPIQQEGNLYSFKSYFPPIAAKVSNSNFILWDLNFANIYIVEQENKFKIHLNLNNNSWDQKDTLVKTSVSFPNVSIGPLGIGVHQILIYPVWEDSMDGHIHLFTKKEYVSTSYVKNESDINEFILYQNYPNPFNPVTKIEYKLRKASGIKFIVINILGETVFEKNYGFQLPGNYKIDFDGTVLSSGVYLYSIITEENKLSRKMVLMK